MGPTRDLSEQQPKSWRRSESLGGQTANRAEKEGDVASQAHSNRNVTTVQYVSGAQEAQETVDRVSGGNKFLSLSTSGSQSNVLAVAKVWSPDKLWRLRERRW